MIDIDSEIDRLTAMHGFNLFIATGEGYSWKIKSSKKTLSTPWMKGYKTVIAAKKAALEYVFKEMGN